jgi:hypothetical protein
VSVVWGAAGQRPRADGLNGAAPSAAWSCVGGLLRQAPCPTWLLVRTKSRSLSGLFTGTVAGEDLYATMNHAFRCEDCSRLHIFWGGLDADPTIYHPETS